MKYQRVAVFIYAKISKKILQIPTFYNPFFTLFRWAEILSAHIF